jgi:hypothetical protein
MKKIILIFTIFLGFLNNAQGCSDAGFCTIGDIEHTSKNTFIVATTFAKGENNISIFSPYIEYHRKLSDKIGLQSKMTSQNSSLNGVSHFNFGDLFLATSYNISDKLNAFVGTKIPLSNPDIKHDSRILPMEYQASLGTFDLLLGVNYQIQKFNLGLSYQQPLIQNNKGFWGDYKRSADLLAKVNYNWAINKKLTIDPSAQFIYHLQNDQSNGIDINDSKGLTLNAVLNFSYKLSSKNSINLIAASPLAVRKSRPDGLTRKFVATLQYQFDF